VGGLYERLASTSSGDTIEERFRVYAAGRQIAEIYRNPSTNETQYFHADAIGTVDTISTDGPSFRHQDFDPFGAPTDPLSVPLTRGGLHRARA
jgi:hypothetical protein